MTVVEQLAEFAVAQRATPLAGNVRHAAVRAVVDWVSATVPGAATPAARALTEALAPGPGPARLIPSGQATDVRTAALLNGTAAHAAELDDIYRDAFYHPGAPTIAAAFAVADQLDCSGEDFLRAVTIGYETGARIALAAGPEHYRHWHTTGTVGTFGAAAAAAELLRLDADRFAGALALAATMAAGLQQTFRSPSTGKPLHAGHAAEAGVVAALAAGKGLAGALDVLEGPAGFGVATAGISGFSVSGLGDPFCVTATTVKYHACCGHTFAAIDAALRLRAEGMRPEEITGIEIETYETATRVAGRTDPAGPDEARFSLAYTVAAALVLGAVRLHAFAPEALHDPVIRTLMARTTTRVDPELDRLAPGRRAARVRVTDRHGTVRDRLRLTRKGDPDDPLSDDELREKFDELVPAFLGRPRAGSIAGTLWRLPALKRMSDLDWGPGPPLSPAGRGCCAGGPA
ncbi:MmgE/PrpD family protein [Streptomyces cylindrosporus]|uniref:MmgE/PrpD family protein n=1 Tax=Streptomyces cylindrosporus TaxID=2927583 RepID=A0ABS9YDJ7_9ACTN|nr:MmgE/PrpD family protein [Streptomyces cylindrosporus]MCI3275301.1 MmgE/PrpD family protein [Streptomyces cylindrosporus]